MWEPAIVLLDESDRPELAHNDIARPDGGHGIAVVASVGAEGWPDASARLVATSDSWVLHAFGCETPLTPIGLTTEDLDSVTDLLDASCTPLIIENDEASTALNGEAEPQSDSTFAHMGHEIVVRLMGGVDVVSRAGDVGQFERSKTVELIAWLATHRTSSTRTSARTALWELDVRDATFANVVSEARRALGRLVPPPNEEEWLARTLTEQLPLHPSVVTDAQLIEERVCAARLQSPAQAIETLRPAAEMIRDMPFAGTSYLWPDAEGITSNLVLLATAVTTELAGHALTVGDVDLVFWATGQGLKVLNGHEELIGLRMRAHAHAGDMAGVRQEWESYERVIVADAWSDGEPAPKLLELRRELLAPSS